MAAEAGAGGGDGAGGGAGSGDSTFMHKGRRIEIREVWAENLEAEMAIIRELVDDYPCVAMDTEFPGVVARPIGSFASHTDYHYQTLRCNVDLLKIIQLGITFANEKGEVADDCPTWQFNFQFDLETDMFAQDSIDLLRRSGINFGRHKADGIRASDFAELLVPSGLVLNPDVKWISFHSGYDFGYLLKLLTCVPLPEQESKFFEALQTWFPCIYDIKFMMTSCDTLKGGLNKLAADLHVQRVGPMHQAGSDSLLTSSVFFEMIQAYFDSAIDDKKFRGVLYGLGSAG